MLDRLCIIVECFNILICLYFVYRKKIRRLIFFLYLWAAFHVFINYKLTNEFHAISFLSLFLLGIVIAYVFYQWQRAIHIRQQREKYCNTVIEHNKFNVLPKCNWPIVMGFLYHKLSEADEKGIQVRASIKIQGPTDKIPAYIMVELLGILLDNAIEALEGSAEPILYLLMYEENGLCINVANPVSDLPYKKISHIFEKGYSSKEGHSGLGLYKLAEFGEKFGFEQGVVKMTFEERECICFYLKF